MMLVNGPGHPDVVHPVFISLQADQFAGVPAADEKCIVLISQDQNVRPLFHDGS